MQKCCLKITAILVVIAFCVFVILFCYDRSNVIPQNDVFTVQWDGSTGKFKVSDGEDVICDGYVTEEGKLYYHCNAVDSFWDLREIIRALRKQK